MIWLEEFHINKYVRPYDARAEARYIKVPEFPHFTEGDRVMIRPLGRYKAFVSRKLCGKYGVVLSVAPTVHRYFGHYVTVRLVTGQEVTILQAGLKKI